MKKTIYNICLILLVCMYSQLYCLTSGPSMPEYNDFESVDNTDLVNLVTGQFSYSIPVMTVPGPGLGFPIVLNYHAGILQKQEASWVGLGWNLQAGAITRQVNKVPDDFAGDIIEEVYTSQRIHGWLGSIAYNGYTVGVSYDSENGLGGMVGYTIGIPNTPIGIGVTAGVNGVYEGVGVTLSVTGTKDLGGDFAGSAGMSVGIHTKRGVSAGVFAGLSMTTPPNENGNKTTLTNLGNIGASLSSKGGFSGGATIGMSFKQSVTLNNRVTESNSSGFIPLPTPIGYFQINWGTWEVRVDGLEKDMYYGFLYSNFQDMNCSAGENCSPSGITLPDVTRQPIKKMEFNSFSKNLDSDIDDGARLAMTAEDFYSVQTQGISGTFKPYRSEHGEYFAFVSKDFEDEDDCNGFWGGIGNLFGHQCPRKGTNLFYQAFENVNYEPHANESFSTAENLIWRFSDESGGGLYTNYTTTNTGPAFNLASKKIKPIFSNKEIIGWIITKADGMIYMYTYPQYNYYTETISALNLAEASTKNIKQIQPGFAYAWLLTAIKSPDYVSVGNHSDCFASECLPQKSDLGGWVRFKYTNRQVYKWETPYGNPFYFNKMGFDASNNANNFQRSQGVKSVAYLEEIITPTHTAQFKMNDDVYNSRRDALVRPTFPDGFEFYKQLPLPGTHNYGGDVQCWRYEPNYNVPQNQKELYLGINDYKVPTKLPNGTKVKLFYYEKIFTTGDYAYHNDDGNINGNNCLIGRGPTLYESNEIIVSSGEIEFSANELYGPLKIQVVDFGVGDDGKENEKKLRILESIILINDVFDEEIASVKFGYDYSLAKYTANTYWNSGGSPLVNTETSGRLTLNEVYIGQSSNGPWLPPYKFDYNGDTDNAYNPTVPPENSPWYDRWGYYCKTCSDGNRESNGQDANVWNLDKIKTPSGLEISMGYESHTYKYISNVENVFEFPSELPEGIYISDVIKNDVRVQDLFFKYLGNVTVPGGGVFNLSLFKEENSNPDYYILDLMDDPDKYENVLIYEGWLKYGIQEVLYPFEDSDAFIEGQNLSAIRYGWLIPAAELDVEHKIIKQSLDPSTGATNIKSMARVWAVYNSKPNSEFIGGGIRTKYVDILDPVTGLSNRVDYIYENGVTSTMPPSYSFYSSEFPYSTLTGEAAMAGAPGISYSSVIANFGEFKTKYHFVTPRDLQVEINRIDNPGVSTSKIAVYDPTTMWGMLWKKEEIDNKNNIVMSETKKWAMNWKFESDLDVIPSIKPDNKVVTIENNEIVASGVNTNMTGNDSYFGISQKFYSGLYIADDCMEASGSAASCMQGSRMSTQIQIFKLSPFLISSAKQLDGVVINTGFDYFDLITGSPRISYKENNNLSTVTYSVPAYEIYPEMKTNNMLTQNYSTTLYEHNSDNINNLRLQSFTNLTNSENVSNSTVTIWSNSITGGNNKWRKYEEFALRDKSDFELPSSGFMGNSKWVSSGQITKYSDFGSVLETIDPIGNYKSKLYGYNQSLQIAQINNSSLNGVFYESFEILDDVKEKVRSGYESDVHYVVIDFDESHSSFNSFANAKTGNSALYVTGDQPGLGNMTCFNLDYPFIQNKEYSLSAWYFDKFNSQNALPQPKFYMSNGSEAVDNGTENIGTGSFEWKRLELKHTFSTPGNGDSYFCIYSAHNVAGQGELIYDEIRVSPTESFMSTYAYNAKSQIISSCDENELVTKYIYDELGNLTGIKNDDGILLTEQMKTYGDPQ